MELTIKVVIRLWGSGSGWDMLQAILQIYMCKFNIIEPHNISPNIKDNRYLDFVKGSTSCDIRASSFCNELLLLDVYVYYNILQDS